MFNEPIVNSMFLAAFWIALFFQGRQIWLDRRSDDKSDKIADLEAENSRLKEHCDSELKLHEKLLAEYNTMRKTLEDIAANKRKTLEQRLASSCIKFLDALK